MRDKLENLITELLLNNNESTIWKTDYVYLKTYHQYLITLKNRGYIEKDVIDNFVDSFQEIKDIKATNIEKVFYDILEDYVIEYFNLDEIYKVDSSGLYFLFNEFGNIIYIGKSIKNLPSRSIQSFVSKLPLGATSIKLLPLPYSKEIIDAMEAIAIIEYNPVANQQKEELSVNYYSFSRLSNIIRTLLFNTKKIFPTYHKEIDY